MFHPQGRRDCWLPGGVGGGLQSPPPLILTYDLVCDKSLAQGDGLTSFSWWITQFSDNSTRSRKNYSEKQLE